MVIDRNEISVGSYKSAWVVQDCSFVHYAKNPGRSFSYSFQLAGNVHVTSRLDY
jgi:hypothetical protein